MKILTTLSLVVVPCALLATLWVGCQATNSTWGYAHPYDILLHRENVIVKSRWLQVVSRDVIYPAPGYISTRTISAIKAIDRARKHGGYAALYKGGPGYRNVTIHFKSQRGEGLNYTVEIWGR